MNHTRRYLWNLAEKNTYNTRGGRSHTGTYRSEKAQRANTKGRSLKSTLVEAPPPAVAGESSRWRSPNPRLPSKPHLWRRSNTHRRHMPPTRGETASPFNCIWLVVKVVLKPSSTVKEQRGLTMSPSHSQRGQEMRPTEALKPSERRQVRHTSIPERSAATITGKYVSNPWPLIFPAKTEQTEKKADKGRKEREPHRTEAQRPTAGEANHQTARTFTGSCLGEKRE